MSAPAIPTSPPVTPPPDRPASPFPEDWQLSDLLAALGDIPAERVRLYPWPGTATEEDAIRLTESSEPGLYELVDGTLVRKPMSWFESNLAVVLIAILDPIVRQQKLGFLLAPDGMVRATGQLREPDVSIFLFSQFPGGIPPRTAALPYPPALAVEILSPTNTAREIERKRREYFAGGTRLLWTVEPELRSVTVWTGPDQSHILTQADTLDGGDVVPGFALPIARWFADAAPRAAE